MFLKRAETSTTLMVIGTPYDTLAPPDTLKLFMASLKYQQQFITISFDLEQKYLIYMTLIPTGHLHYQLIHVQQRSLYR